MYALLLAVPLAAVATAVAVLAARARLPAPPILVVVGVAAGLLPQVHAPHFRPSLVGAAVLPPLLFAAAQDVALPALNAVRWTVARLATGLVVATAAAVAVVAQVVPGISLGTGFVLGAVVASTDPVAVGVLARRLHLPPRLLALAQGESLLNDATSLVLFGVAVDAVSSGHVGPAHVALSFVRLGLGGALLGAVIALVAGRLPREHPAGQLTAALVVPYLTYTGAQAFGLSGVTAVVILGLAMSGPVARHRESSRRIAAIDADVVFVLGSAVFALVGLELPSLARGVDGSDAVQLAGLVTAAVVGVRLAWFAIEVGVGRVARGSNDWRVAGVLAWAGTRGVLPLVAALSIPLHEHGGLPFPHRSLVQLGAVAVIVSTLAVQGLSLGPVVRWLDPTGVRRGAKIASNDVEGTST